MDNEDRESLPPVVPMPPGDHIFVSDPFIGEFEPLMRSQYAYASNSIGHTWNPSNSYSYSPSAPAPSCYYSQNQIHIPSTMDVPSGALGRFFPGDQPVIVQNNAISPTHPYIPPVFPCGLCRREILDNVQAVQCYLGCKFWFHRTCVGLPEETFQRLLKDPYAEWMCDPCYESKKDMIDDSQYTLVNRNIT